MNLCIRGAAFAAIAFVAVPSAAQQAQLQGTLTTVQNVPLAGATVSLLPQPEVGAEWAMSPSTQTGSGGAFVLSVAPGSYIPVVSPAAGSGLVAVSASPQVLYLTADTPVALKVQTAPGQDFDGRLVDPHDVPVANARMFVVPNMRGYGSAQSDAGGDFVLPLANAGERVEMLCEPDIGCDVFGQERSDQLSVELAPPGYDVVWPMGTVMGSVVGDDGPLANVRIEVTYQGADTRAQPPMGWSGHATAYTDAQGDYTLRVPHGTLDFAFTPPAGTAGLGPAAMQLTLAEDALAMPVDIYYAAGGVERSVDTGTADAGMGDAGPGTAPTADAGVDANADAGTSLGSQPDGGMPGGATGGTLAMGGLDAGADQSIDAAIELGSGGARIPADEAFSAEPTGGCAVGGSGSTGAWLLLGLLALRRRRQIF